MRKTSEELAEIKKKYGVNEIWSWSRLEKARTSLYEFYLTYIKHEKEDRTDCIYGVMGSMCHEILEKLYNGEINYDDMPDLFDDNWLVAVDVTGLKFDRNDTEKNRNIGAKYRENLKHFYAHHNKIPFHVITEEFILTQFAPNIIFQGYADAMFEDSKGNHHIIDFKTSTKYAPSVQKEKCGQLVCYALGLHQTGIPLDKIKIAWNFLKYVTIKYTLANGEVRSKDVERKDIGKSVLTSVRMWLKKCGYDEEEYLNDVILNNSIDGLPKEVRDKFVIRDCYVYVDLTEDLIDYWTNEVIATVEEMNKRVERYAIESLTNANAEEIFFDDMNAIEKDSYYYATLSGYSAKLNKPYQMYLDKLKKDREEKDRLSTDIFAGVGSDTDDDEFTALLNSI